MANILYIEPDNRLAKMYAEALQAAGHKVQLAATAQAAIFAADAIRPDVVFLELQLTEHSGVEFLYEFRSYPDWQTIPVVVVSTVPPQEFAASQALLQQELGVIHYHYKPQLSLRQLKQLAEELTSVAA